jgi:long-chain-fatty-acid--CoA ligase ACSBG
MLSHDNIVCATRGDLHELGKYICVGGDYQETIISYLPLSHIAAQLVDIWMPIMAGHVLWFARPDALKGTLTQTMKTARPTFLVGVPRVYEKIEEKLKSMGAASAGAKMPNSAIHKVLGLDRAKLIMTAAAPISKQTLEFFASLDLPLYEIYGMSETAGALTMGLPACNRITSIGPQIHLNEARIDKPDEDGSGEMCFRGRNIFMGYLNNEEKVKETIDDDGWIHTGDVGKIDQDGFIYITGRIKEILITAGGENIAPVPIEERIKEHLPLVSQAMVIGDKRKFLSVILTLQVVMDTDTGLPTDELTPLAQKYCQDLGLDVTTAHQIAPDVPDALSKAINDAMAAANKKATSNAWKVQKWKLLPLDFTTSGGELGPTQKLRRPQVTKMYHDIIEEFYV